MSLYVRYQPIALGGGGGGVTSLNSETGAVVLVPGIGISVTPSGQNITTPNTLPSLGGTVTSVGLADGSAAPIYTITGSPVTSSGTLTLTLNTQPANTVFAGPSTGSAAQPTFRALVAADIPSLSTTYVTQSEVGQPNGVASLDSAGHVPLTQLPPTLVEYLGTWNANTNTPTLANGTGVSGQFYIVSVAGTTNFGAGPITFNTGDWVLYNGSIWERAVQSNVVQSVNGQTGVVTINAINQLTGQITAGPASGSASAVSTIAANTVTNSNLAQMPTNTIKGNNTGSAANAADLTVAQINAILPVFTSTLNGLTPLSGGGTTNFLRADGTWAVAGTGSVTSVSVVSTNGLAGTVANPTTTPALTLSTTVTGILQGNGTAISAATTTGTGAVVLQTSPSLVTPALGTPSSGVLTNATGLPVGGIAAMAADTLVGNNTGSSASPTALTVAQVNAILPVFTASLNGLVPLSGGGTTNFLRADGSWAVAGSGTVTSVAMTVPAFLSISGSPVTTSGTLGVGLSGTALPIANGGTAVTSVTTTPTATAFSGWDANKNLSANNLLEGYTTTATAAGTTVLTVGSTYQQYFTGTTTQILVLPATSTLVLGQSFVVTNNSTGIVTVQSSGTNTVLAQAANTTTVYTCILITGTTATSWNASVIGAGGAITPTVQKFLSGSGTYTTPTGVAYIQVQMVGGGGGGGGSGTTSGTAAGSGGTTTFGTSLLTATGGGAGANAPAGTPISGGTATVNSPAIAVTALGGGQGSTGTFNNGASNTQVLGGTGGATPFGGAGSGSGNAVGGPAQANSGSGGGGAGAGNLTSGGGGTGGGAGAYINAIIVSPSATYSYSVGTLGSGGGAGSSGQNAGSGGSGVIIVTEYYNNGAVGTATTITQSNTAGQVLTGNGSGSSSFQALVTNNYYSGTMPSAASWSTTSTSFVDGTNSGGNTLTAIYSNGISVAAAGSNVAGITFTPASSTSVYHITATTSVYSNSNSASANAALTDGTTTFAWGTTAQNSTAGSLFVTTLSGIYAPGTGSSVTVKVQISGSNTVMSGYNGSGAGHVPSIMWQIIQIK